jgi:hypothetical protein
MGSKKAISKTAKLLLYVPLKKLGVKGINQFANGIVQWPLLFP